MKEFEYEYCDAPEGNQYKEDYNLAENKRLLSPVISACSHTIF